MVLVDTARSGRLESLAQRPPLTSQCYLVVDRLDSLISLDPQKLTDRVAMPFEILDEGDRNAPRRRFGVGTGRQWAQYVLSGRRGAPVRSRRRGRDGRAAAAAEVVLIQVDDFDAVIHVIERNRVV
jgi:hypothetical protein